MKLFSHMFRYIPKLTIPLLLFEPFLGSVPLLVMLACLLW
jgi:hypothetical protein